MYAQGIAAHDSFRILVKEKWKMYGWKFYMYVYRKIVKPNRVSYSPSQGSIGIICGVSLVPYHCSGACL